MLPTKLKYPRKIKPRCHRERWRLAERCDVYQLYCADFYRVPGGMGLRRLAVVFTAIGIIAEIDFGWPVTMSWEYSALVVDRIWDVMNNWVLVALPMFILMGIMLEKSGLAGRLLENLATLLERVPGGLAISVTTIGVLLAASTGIIGASVVLLGLLAASMLRQGYQAEFATGTVAAVGTLGIDSTFYYVGSDG